MEDVAKGQKVEKVKELTEAQRCLLLLNQAQEGSNHYGN